MESLLPAGWGVVLGIGIGAALLMRRGIRPLAKQAVKGYLAASDGMMRATSGAKEELQELYSEAKAEQEGRARSHPSEADTQP